MTDGRLARGERTRRAVLDRAVALASVDGLEAMSLAKLAASLGVSKSALFSHWADKEQLQLDVVSHAQQQWIDHIVAPALTERSAPLRLWALHERRLRFYEDETIPGGCFFNAVEPEYDDRPGPVRDAIKTAKSAWLGLLVDVTERGVTRGQLDRRTEPAQLAFEIEALGEAVITHSRLLDNAASADLARRAVLSRLRALATDPSELPEEEL